MKKLMIILTALFTMTVSANAMSYEQARQQAADLAAQAEKENVRAVLAGMMGASAPQTSDGFFYAPKGTAD